MDRDLADADDRMGCVTLPLAAVIAGPHSFNEPVVLDSVPHGTLAGKMMVRASLPAQGGGRRTERARTRLEHGKYQRNCAFWTCVPLRSLAGPVATASGCRREPRALHLNGT
jgi:hypothetical protein